MSNEPQVALFCEGQLIDTEILTLEIHQSGKRMAAGLARQGIIQVKGGLEALRAGLEVSAREGYGDSEEFEETTWKIDWISYDDNGGAKVAMTEVVDA